jgi:hypothetical protein
VPGNIAVAVSNHVAAAAIDLSTLLGTSISTSSVDTFLPLSILTMTFSGPTAKLLMLPLLLYHCERSLRGVWVFIAFLASCMVLMAASWLVAFNPDLSLKLYLSRGPYERANGIFVKNYIDQSQEFVLCAVALAYPVMALLRRIEFGWRRCSRPSP